MIGKTLLDRESGLTNPRSYFYEYCRNKRFCRGNYTFRSKLSQETVTVSLLEEDATWPRLTPPQVTLKWYKRCRFLSLCKVPMPPLASVPQSDLSRILFCTQHYPYSRRANKGKLLKTVAVFQRSGGSEVVVSTLMARSPSHESQVFDLGSGGRSLSLARGSSKKSFSNSFVGTS